MSRVVIFDPGSNDLDALVNSFDSERFRVLVVRDQSNFISEISSHDPDCLIVYLQDCAGELPVKLSALAAAAALEDVPLIAVRPLDSNCNAAEAIRRGVLQILSLPLTPDIIEANVAGMIRQRRSVRELRSRLELQMQNLDALQEDLEEGQGVQQSLLPPARMRSGHFHIESAWLPSGKLCGDYQDYKLLSNGRLAVFQADVSGHGFASALVASRLKAYFDDNVDGLEDPGAFLQELNRVLLSYGEHYKIATAVCLLLDRDRGELRIANAGHRTTYWFNRDGDDYLAIPSSGPALGMFEDYEIEGIELPLRWQNNRIVIFTDGLIEFKQDDHRWVSEESFRDNILRRGLDTALEDYTRTLLNQSHELTEHGTWDDDVSLLILDFS